MQKHPLKRIFGVALAVFGCVLIISSCRVGAGVSALAVDTVVTLTSAQTVALFGSSIPCSYLVAGEGGQTTRQDGIVTYLVTETLPALNGADGTGTRYNMYYTATGQSFESREICWYSMPWPSDLSYQPTGIIFDLKTAVDISSVSIIDTAFASNPGNVQFDIDNGLYGTFDAFYAHTSFGDFPAVHRGQIGTSDYNYYGYILNSISVKCPFIPIYRDATAAAASFGWVYLPIVGNTDGRLVVGIVCPRLSDGWVYDGNTGAGAGSGSGGSSGGSSDLTGIESRLDTIISKLDDIAAGTSGGADSTTDPDNMTGFDGAPDSFDFDAAWDVVTPALDMPFVPSANTPGGGSGMEIYGSVVPALSGAPDITSSDLGGGISIWWYLLSQVVAALPILSKLIIAGLMLGIASYFIFRG